MEEPETFEVHLTPREMQLLYIQAETRRQDTGAEHWERIRDKLRDRLKEIHAGNAAV